jgi:aromatic ring-opening dioxygenase catalytic subunit (LigB family)
MARVVAAFSTSHAPMMLVAPESAPVAQRNRILEALLSVSAKIRQHHAQAVIIIANEHFTNFFLDNFPQHCIGVGDFNFGPAERWLEIPEDRIPGNSRLGEGLVQNLLKNGFEPAFSHRLLLDHGVMTPYHLIDPGHETPLIPILQNCAVSPMSSLANCYRLGRALGTAIAATTAVDRVAVVASGGLSHSVGTARTGYIDSDFDRWFLDRIAKNELADVLEISDEELEHAGNGAHEIRSWLTLAGIVDRPASIRVYEPVQSWITGIAVAEYDMVSEAR